MEIQPVETFVFDGLVQRFAQVFGCRAIIVTTTDKTQTLQKMFEGRPVEYPYAFLSLKTFAADSESYAGNMLARRGVPIAVTDNKLYSARILPTKFEFEVEFHTNKFNGIEVQTVTGFARRWLFARRCGYLKFNIKYGRVEMPCGTTLDESVAIPTLENKVETEAVYKVTTTMTIKGWSSEPVLGTQGVINNTVVDVAVAADGSVPGYEFIPFN